ncbi:MAG: uroporphyrinogen-III C-methyltransferase [Betaproteobacteria bacterium]|nr:uroporphyrinogen-III C-methyltransferase [Betaproteobacteria bacterium]
MPVEASRSRHGMVYIVGAGPGPADLLTLRALDRIQRAEVVLHDRLIAPDVLALLPPQAERLYVGKALGHHAVAQAQIHALLIEQARMGRCVVRLKGGDPHIFGRGGEEVQALQAAGLSFEVVPGVSASNGCASAAGIPLTHRELAHSCTFLSGHLAQGDIDSGANLDWAALARPRQTRVFYMGVERVASIARRLIAHGLAPDTPAAIVQDGTRPSQRVWAMGLEALVEQAPPYGPRPGLLIIGETVALSPHFVAAVAASLSPGAKASQPREQADHFSGTGREPRRSIPG